MFFYLPIFKFISACGRALCGVLPFFKSSVNLYCAGGRKLNFMPAHSGGIELFMKELVYVVIFIAATLIGYKVINKVPSLLHTPLMSGMNALSGVTILGALAATAAAVGTGSKILGALAIVLAMINVAGGFGVTGRMLKMFNKKNGGDK